MKKIFPIFFLLILFVLSVNAQQLVQKKEYHDWYKTKIARIYYVNGNGMMQGDDTKYYESGKILATQKWSNGILLHSTKYFETGTIERIWNNNNKEEAEGEQKWFAYKEGKYYQYLYAKILDGIVMEYRYFAVDKSITEDYKRNMYFKSKYSNFTIKDGKLTGTGVLNNYKVKLKDNMIQTAEIGLDSFDPDSNWPFYGLYYVNDKKIVRAKLSDSKLYKMRCNVLPFSIKFDNQNKISFNDDYLTDNFKCKVINQENKIPKIEFYYEVGNLGPNLNLNIDIEDIISQQVMNTVLDSSLIIANVANGKFYLKKEYFFENGLLLWTKERNKEIGGIVYKEYKIIRKYNRTFDLNDSADVKTFLIYSFPLNTCLFNPDNKYYTESIEGVNDKDELVPLADIEAKIQKDKLAQFWQKQIEQFRWRVIRAVDKYGSMSNFNSDAAFQIYQKSQEMPGAKIILQYIEIEKKYKDNGMDFLEFKVEQIEKAVMKFGLDELNEKSKNLSSFDFEKLLMSAK